MADKIKVGGACKLLNEQGETVPELNFRSTTVRYLSTLSKKERRAMLAALVEHNLSALLGQVSLFSWMPEPLRMWRLNGDILPMRTHPIADDFYTTALLDWAESEMTKIGKLARKSNVRLSFHPAQYVVLGSQNANVRAASMRELEAFGELFWFMGYRKWHQQGLAINVHVGPKVAAVKEMRRAIKNAPESVRNWLTLENDEFSWGTEAIVETFGDLVPIVLDVHHHWINAGVYLQPGDPLVDKIRATWRGEQPKLHLAMSHRELCDPYGPRKRMVLSQLLEHNTKAALRAHSYDPWHLRTIDYAATFGFDIMWEGKNKNLGAMQIAQHLRLV